MILYRILWSIYFVKITSGEFFYDDLYEILPGFSFLVSKLGNLSIIKFRIQHVYRIIPSSLSFLVSRLSNLSIIPSSFSFLYYTDIGNQ